MFTTPTKGEGEPREGRVTTLIAMVESMCAIFGYNDYSIGVFEPKLVW